MKKWLNADGWIWNKKNYIKIENKQFLHYYFEKYQELGYFILPKYMNADYCVFYGIWIKQ